MARVSIETPCFFSKEAYRHYLEVRATIENERFRKPDETIFDALLSDEADFTKGENGKEIVEALGRAGNLC